MHVVVWHPDAELDLLNILEFVGNRDLAAAKRLVQAIRDSTRILAVYPELYKMSDRLHGCREIVAHPNYIVIYQVLSQHVRILKIAHSRQQYPVSANR